MSDVRPQTGLFDGCVFLFVSTKSLTQNVIDTLAASVTEHGGVVVDTPRAQRGGTRKGLPVTDATHVVSNSIDFPEYAECTACMVPVVTSDWVTASLVRGKTVNLRAHSPDPRMIFSNVVLTCADIPVGDKEAIAGAVLAMGGRESKDVSRMTTHICALSMEHPKVIKAKAKLECKIVLPHWFDDCFRLGKRIDEGPYLLPNPEILTAERDDKVPQPSSQHLEGASDPAPTSIPMIRLHADGSRGPMTVFEGKAVMLCGDLQLRDRLEKAIREIVTGGGGKVVDDVDDCDWFVGRYRDGPKYVRAAQWGKDVGSLAWLFHLITHDEWTSPLRRLLHYPVPRGGLAGFEGFRISVSGYGGEARLYLENLVIASGGVFTTTMRADNTHLITAMDTSEKCEAARDWNINMVNHLWLEESFARCELQTLSNPRYTTFPQRTNLAEVIGQTFFDESRLRKAFYPGDPEDLPADAKRRRRILEKAQENVYSKGPAEGMPVGKAPGRFVVLNEDEYDAAEQKVAAQRKAARELLATGGKAKKAAAAGRHVKTGKENKPADDAGSTTSHGSRRAKDKALSTLHDLAPDVELYEKEKRRASVAKDHREPWGGKRAAQQTERDVLAARELKEGAGKKNNNKRGGAREDTATGEDEEEETDAEDTAKRPAKKQKTGPGRQSLPPVQMRLQVTTYDRWIGDHNKNNEDKDRRKLRELGVQIVADGQPCDFLCAPAVKKTVKFLMNLSRGVPILSSAFVDHMLDTSTVPPRAAIARDWALRDPAGEKEHRVSLGQSLERARALRRGHTRVSSSSADHLWSATTAGGVLWQVPVYCSTGLPLGVKSYKLVAEANGATFVPFSARSGSTIRPTTAEEDGGADPEPVYLLSQPPPSTTNGATLPTPKAEAELRAKFVKMAETGHMRPVIVKPNWLLDVAMRQELLDPEPYLLQ